MTRSIVILISSLPLFGVRLQCAMDEMQLNCFLEYVDCITGGTNDQREKKNKNCRWELTNRHISIIRCTSWVDLLGFVSESKFAPISSNFRKLYSAAKITV